MDENFKKYIIFWLSQSVSQLGSAMTSFALILWVFSIKHSAMTVSLMSFCNYVPFIIASVFAGAFVDRHSKKKIMLTSDSVAALGTLTVLVLTASGNLQIWHIYLVNCVIGCMNAFQSPASGVAVGKLVPKEKLGNVSGMTSFSGNLITVFSPILATALYAAGGLHVILWIDLCSFVFAFTVLLFFVTVPEDKAFDRTAAGKKTPFFKECTAGFSFLKDNKGILLIVITMALLNFLSRLTYENILSPMILLRSGGDNMVLGIVNAVMGAGGIIGGLLVASGKMSKDNIKMIYVSAALSFLFGDLLMGIGQNVFVWAIAGLAASLPIPFINAGQNVILYTKVPEKILGRVFSVRNAIQYSTIPVGILLGGFLADYVFEPFMNTEGRLVSLLQEIVGSSSGSGMAVMFLCTGTFGFLFSLLSYFNKNIQEMRNI